MGKKHDKKHDKKGKKKVVLSLAEFNEDAGRGGVDPELAALPNAPKAAEEWEAQGGRPEYNSRGYKERTSSAFKERGYDDDFDDRDWARRGPMEENENSSGFGTGVDRDWGDMRRGPLQEDGTAAPERNWDDMRRGPVESAFNQENPTTRDWGVRKGPVEAEAPSRTVGDEDWGSARRKGVEAEFSQEKPPKVQDWSARKPVEADGGKPTEEADWTVRKGPVEADVLNTEEERDWSVRKGPVDAGTSKTSNDTDWSDARRGPIEADVPKRKEAERDWGMRRGPIESEPEASSKPSREVDFTEMRRGSKLMELNEPQGASITRQTSTSRPSSGREGWRQDARPTPENRVPSEEPGADSTVSSAENSASKERDWSAARRGQPVASHAGKTPPPYGRHSEPRKEGRNRDREDATEPDAAVVPDSDWTTVRSGGQRRSLGRRGSGGNDGDLKKSEARFSGDRRSMRSSLKDARPSATTSPVTPATPATPAMSES